MILSYSVGSLNPLVAILTGEGCLFQMELMGKIEIPFRYFEGLLAFDSSMTYGTSLRFLHIVARGAGILYRKVVLLSQFTFFRFCVAVSTFDFLIHHVEAVGESNIIFPLLCSSRSENEK
jgi:hypothetical protein